MSKEDVKQLYDAYGQNMCLAPFFNSFYSTCGVVPSNETVVNYVRPCSVIQAGTQWNIVNNNITDSRNTKLWKDVRQTFLNGMLPDLCTTCINAERYGSSSPRQLNNEYLFEHLDIDIIAELQRIIDADMFADKVYAIDYMPSNFCNYACVMCYSGASSQRYTFELKQGRSIKYEINPVDSDFFDIVKDIKILGFTGGETIIQPEVIRLIDYVIEHDLAKDMIITILTNVSDFPDAIIEKFKKFKRVLYTISIDGVGDVIEYQRRGAKWSVVEANAVKIHNTVAVDEIVNHVITSINILTAMDFVNWCRDNDFKFISVSNVFQPYLGLSAMPLELKELALARLEAGRQEYEQYANEYQSHKRNWLTTIDQLISTVKNSTFDPQALKQFVNHIKTEDLVSKKPLCKVVPEWAPWFV